jgi:sphingosine kinase
MKVDAFSLTQNGKRTITFMSQALGLMADVDIGTEHLRWMGDARFLVGLMKGCKRFLISFFELLLTWIKHLVIQFRSCPIQLSVKVAEDDKKKIVQNFQTHHNENGKRIPTSPSPPVAEDVESGTLPPLRYSIDDTDGWVTVDEPILYLYAGKGPYVSR